MQTHSVSTWVALRLAAFPLVLFGALIVALSLIIGMNLFEKPLLLAALCFGLGLALAGLLRRRLRPHN